MSRVTARFIAWWPGSARIADWMKWTHFYTRAHMNPHGLKPGLANFGKFLFWTPAPTTDLDLPRVMPGATDATNKLAGPTLGVTDPQSVTLFCLFIAEASVCLHITTQLRSVLHPVPGTLTQLHIQWVHRPSNLFVESKQTSNVNCLTSCKLPVCWYLLVNVSTQVVTLTKKGEK